MTAYQIYTAQMDKLKATKPYMSERDFNFVHNIETEKETPVFIARKSSSAKQVKPTLDAHIEIKPIKIKRSYKYASTEEERKLARTRYTKQKREKWKVAGLTSKGKPFKTVKIKKGL